jgi:hypothetical protein
LFGFRFFGADSLQKGAKNAFCLVLEILAPIRCEKAPKMRFVWFSIFWRRFAAKRRQKIENQTKRIFGAKSQRIGAKISKTKRNAFLAPNRSDLAPKKIFGAFLQRIGAKKSKTKQNAFLVTKHRKQGKSVNFPLNESHSKMPD